jgi:two-component system, NtrC family, sensor kinase
MKLVAKYTLVLVAALAVALSLLTFYRMERDRAHLEDDMTADHRVVGRVLQQIALDLWRASPSTGSQAIGDLVARANLAGEATRFEWLPGPSARGEADAIEGHDFVSRFPVELAGHAVGTIVVRESLDDTERMVRHGVAFSVVGVGLVVALSFATSLILGRWLVGRPIALLVAKARRIGRRDFAGTVAVGGRDELGELAVAMNTMSDQLAEALAQITLETEARIRAVEQMRHADRLSTVGKLAAGIAHELGTPLSIVAGHAQMIAGGEVTGAVALDSARAIDREAARMSRIVRQLLDFARRRGPEGSASDVGATIERCVELLRPMLTRAQVTPVIAAGPPLRALIDEDSLQQILTNLVVNAVQAMPSGGELSVATARVRAAPPDAPGAPETQVVRITVRDTGTGIPEQVRGHVFEPFYTTKPPGEGTGLGLSVVYGIVADHRGWITLDSADRGAAFSIYLQEVQA